MNKKNLQLPAMKRNLQNDQTPLERLDGLERTFTLENIRQTTEGDNQEIELSFSSEVEVSRWFGVEVLDHGVNAVRLQRLLNSAPVLVNHDRDDQIGVVISAHIDQLDRRGHATIRFGNSARAQEIYKDVKDGIRKNVSIHYKIYRYEVTEGTGSNPDLIRIMDWEPTEISIVSIPADSTVGIGRSEEINLTEEGEDMPKILGQKSLARNDETSQPVAQNPTTSQPITTEQRSQPVVTTPAAPIITNEQARAEERQRIATITTVADNANWDLSNVRDEAINNGWSLEQFRAAAFEHIAAQPQPRAAVVSQEMLNQGNQREYSLVRALNAQISGDWSQAGFEREISQELQRNGGEIMGGGLIVPMSIFARADTTTNATLIGTAHLASQFIDTLRDSTLLGRLGARFLTGLVGNVSIPRKTGNAQFGWLAENAAATDSNVPTGSVSLTGKHIGGVVPLTFELMRQSSPAIEQIVRADMLEGIALAIDLAGIAGTGANNQPLGIWNTTGVQTKTFANLAAPTFSEIVSMEGMVRTQNALKGSLSYVFHPTVLSTLKTTPKDSGSGRFVIESNECNGYQAHDSTQMPANATMFGNFSDILIGSWGMVEMIPKRDENTGGLRIGCHQMSDVTVRHAQSFVKAVA